MASSVKVEFHFDFGSPNAYLAEHALPAVEKLTGVKFDYVPVLLGGVYKATNNMSPAESLRGIKNKPEYQALETSRFIQRHNITTFKPPLPQKSIATALRAPELDASEAFAAFVGKLGLPRKLSDVGVGEDRFGLIGENAMLSIFTRSNPQPIRETADVVQILRLAA